MKSSQLINLLENSPMVAAVKSDDGLESCLQSEVQVVFVLYGSINTIGAIITKIKDAGKIGFIHIDLIDGLASREAAVDFVLNFTHADGIISTKQALVRYAKQQGLLTVQRFFILDSISLTNVQKQLAHDCADLIEVLPGVMPKIIRMIAINSQKPIIAGGLIQDKEDVVNALGAGAIAVSSTNPKIWFL